MAPEFVTELLGNTQTFITLRVLQNKYMRLHEDPPVTNAVRFLQMLCTCVARCLPHRKGPVCDSRPTLSCCPYARRLGDVACH